MWKKICSMAACALLLTPMAMAADSAVHELPYDSYVFSADGTPLEPPAPFVPQQIVTGAGLRVGRFQGLSDIFCGSDGLLVLADAGNNRLILTDTAWNAPVVLASFDNGGRQDAFNNPTGVYVRGNDLYVADAGNARILLFDRATLTLRRELSRPSIPSLGEDYTYKPLKLTADAAGRVYVVAEGINQGLIELNETGAFSTFLGAPSVTPDFFELIWRKFATKEQLAQLEKYVPTEYDAVTIDSDGFLFAVSKNAENTPIAKLNNQGNNVLLFPQKLGDAEFYENKPYFTDLALDERGIVFLLDSKQGKIYAYTQEGDLLFAFGANATQQGCFYSASAMELANGLLYVCDSNKNTVTILEPTAFGAAVVDATILEEQGRYEDAYAHWREVSRRCSHYAPAEVGIAQEEIRQGRYADAMSRLKAIREEDVYATAFEKGRNEWIRNHFLPLLGGAAALILLLLLVPRLVKKWAPVQRLRAAPLVRKFRYATYSAFHPFDGYWDIKREGRGDMKSALLILGIFIVFYAVRAQFSGYSVTGTVSSEVNVLFECLMILLPLAFYVVANWCFTTLMDGEGSLKDIFIASCTALKPYLLFSIPLFLCSHLLTQNEAVFYQTADALCWIWVVALLFLGMMMTHDYSLSKALLAMLLTIVGICLIIFIGLLFINVVQDVVSFFRDIYTEVSFRFY